MSETRKTILYVLGGFVVCVVLMLIMAYSLGADPFEPSRRHIWALGLLAALYVSFRVVTTVKKLTRSTKFDGIDVPFFGKKEHEIDKRMAERKARVAAAKAKQEE